MANWNAIALLLQFGLNVASQREQVREAQRQAGIRQKDARAYLEVYKVNSERMIEDTAQQYKVLAARNKAIAYARGVGGTEEVINRHSLGEAILEIGRVKQDYTAAQEAYKRQDYSILGQLSAVERQAKLNIFSSFLQTGTKLRQEGWFGGESKLPKPPDIDKLGGG